MKRSKILRRIGDSVGVIFNKEEQKLFDLNVGAQVEISITNLNKTTGTDE